MKNKDGGDGEGGGLDREGGLIKFPPLKRGGLFERGGLNRGFTVASNVTEFHLFLSSAWSMGFKYGCIPAVFKVHLNFMESGISWIGIWLNL